MASWFQRLKYLFTGRSPEPSPAGRMAKIDAAQTTPENRNHWKNADSLGPNAFIDEATNQRLRDRSRYEALNNSYLKSLVKTSAYDFIGSSPRPEFKIPGDADGSKAKAVEKLFTEWAKPNQLGRKLRTLAKSSVRDGGGFLIIDNDDDSPIEVKLALREVEADCCRTPTKYANDPNVHLGKRFNRVGRPIEYYFLSQHPGEKNASEKYETIPANFVLHWYEQDRAGQQIGIPQITPALPIYSQLRRFGSATLTAAEFAASIAGILETNQPAGGEAQPLDNWYMTEVVRGALMAAPAGWKPSQMKAEHPSTTYDGFEKSKLNEAGRSIGAPLNVSTGNSSGYNFSSGRLDHLPYQRNHWIDRDDFENVVFDPIVSAWIREAALIPGYLPEGLPPADEWEWSTNWDGFSEIDETKAADADDKRLRNGTTNFATIAAERFGTKWRDVIDQLALEIEYCRSKGIQHPFEGGAGGVESQTISTVDADGNESQATITTPKKADPKQASNATAAAKAGDVQGTALNGAQIASLLAVTDKLAAKSYPADAAEKIIQAAFPLMDRALISGFVQSLDKFAPPKPAEPAQLPPAPTAPVKPAASRSELNGHVEAIHG